MVRVRAMLRSRVKVRVVVRLTADDTYDVYVNKITVRGSSGRLFQFCFNDNDVSPPPNL